MAFPGLLNNIASDTFHLVVDNFTRSVYKFLKLSSVQKPTQPILGHFLQSSPYDCAYVCPIEMAPMA